MPPKKRASESNGNEAEPEKKLNKTSSDCDKSNFEFKNKSKEDKGQKISKAPFFLPSFFQIKKTTETYFLFSPHPIKVGQITQNKGTLFLQLTTIYCKVKML